MMKLRTYMIIFFLSFGWLLSFQENHLCNDEAASSVHFDSERDNRIDISNHGSNEDSEHDGEMCHFGHCSHGIGFRIVQVLLRSEVIRSGPISPYYSTLLAGFPSSRLRPPVFA